MSRNNPALRSKPSNVSEPGFTLIELIMVLVIGLILTLVAIPLINNVYQTFRVNAAISAVTGAIQTTRYQAISNGYPFQVVFSKANSNYQVQRDPNLTGIFANVGNPVPLSTVAVLGQDTTILCHPGGLITATVGSTTLTLTSHSKTESIAISSYGNIKVTP
jgi:prepilin-type N-terminal cleavage/methylation domain-containing protein